MNKKKKKNTLKAVLDAVSFTTSIGKKIEMAKEIRTDLPNSVRQFSEILAWHTPETNFVKVTAKTDKQTEIQKYIQTNRHVSNQLLMEPKIPAQDIYAALRTGCLEKNQRAAQYNVQHCEQAWNAFNSSKEETK